MINAAQRKTLLKLATAEKATFVELAKIASLDPGTAFRGADLRGVDFAKYGLGELGNCAALQWPS